LAVLIGRGLDHIFGSSIVCSSLSVYFIQFSGCT